MPGWRDAPLIEAPQEEPQPGWRGAPVAPPKRGQAGPTKPPPTHPLASALTGAADMISLGGLDELAAGAASIFKGVPYPEALRQARQIKQRAYEDHPVASAAGGLGGAVLTAPAQPFMRAATMTGKVAGGLASGALMGGIYGFNEGEQGPSAGLFASDGPTPPATTGEGFQNRLRSAAEGGLLGGAFGAMAPYAVPLVLRPLGRGAGNVAASAARIIPGPLAKLARETLAARRVAGALARDDQAKSFAPVRSPRETLQSRVPMLERAQRRGQPTILADTGDEWTRALLRSATNTSPEGRGIAQTVLGDRFASQGERAKQFAARLFGTRGDTAARRESLERGARMANDPAYRAAYASAPPGIWTDRIATLTQSDHLQQAMRKALPGARTEAALRGVPPGSIPRNPFVMRNGRLEHRVMPDGSRAIPNLEYWDLVQRNLRDAAEAAKRAGRNNEARQIGELRRELLAELDRIVPKFRDARRGAAAFFGAEDALEAGQMVARNPRMNNQELARGLAQMKPVERELFREGHANEIIQELGRVRDGRNVTGVPWWSTPQGREQVAIVHGARQAKLWQAYGQLENVYNLTRSALGNSQTARYLFEMGLAGGGAMALGGGFNPLDPGSWSTEHIVGALLAVSGRRGMARISEKTSREVARLLASGSPDDIQRAANMVSGSPALSVALSRAEDLLRSAVPRTGVQQAEGAQQTGPYQPGP